MEKLEFFVNKRQLEYNMSGQNSLVYSQLDLSGHEIPSVSYLNLKYENEIYLPILLFQNNLTPLQNIVKYLRENMSLKNSRIAVLLNRDPKTIWVVYENVKKKKTLIIDDSDIQVPLSIFRNRRFSVFESLVCFLKGLDMKYSEIARLLRRDQRTIWTVYSRAKIKDEKKRYEKE
jgi:hypothetical protein